MAADGTRFQSENPTHGPAAVRMVLDLLLSRGGAMDWLLPADAAAVFCVLNEAPSPATQWPPKNLGELEHAMAAPGADTRAYYIGTSVVQVEPGTGAVRNRKAAARALLFIMLDDVGQKVSANPVPPTFRIESSPGSEQWFYVLAVPITDMAYADRVVRTVYSAAGLTDAHGRLVSKFCRLPAGINGKRLPGPELPGKPLRLQWPVRLVDWHPERLFSAEELLDAWGLELLPGRSVQSGGAALVQPGDDPVVAALLEAGYTASRPVPYEGGYKLVLSTCPWSDDHSGGDTSGAAYFGTPAFHCAHSSCQENGRDYSQLLRLLRDDHGYDIATLDFAQAYRPTAEEAFAEVVVPEVDEDAWNQILYSNGRPPPRKVLIPTVEEINKAVLTPRCIVRHYLYADLAVMAAAGGVGKTTLLLYESLHIALGRELWGLPVENSGWTLIVTAEDQRERLIARLREICDAMFLSEEERQTVFENVVFWDVTGQLRKLAVAQGVNILPTALADELCAVHKDDPPAVVVFDPLISFGASEQSINDNEQALVTAARRIIRNLGCCVRYVHHVGQSAARATKSDQYSLRGGTALPDGARMVVMLDKYDPSAIGGEDPPEDCVVDPANTHEAVFKLKRHKLSYGPPNLPTIWIRRNRFLYEHFTDVVLTKDQIEQREADRVEAYIREQLDNRILHTKQTITDARESIGMGRNKVRAAVNRLLSQGKLQYENLPVELQQGARQECLCPTDRVEFVRKFSPASSPFEKFSIGGPDVPPPPAIEPSTPPPP